MLDALLAQHLALLDLLEVLPLHFVVEQNLLLLALHRLQEYLPEQQRLEGGGELALRGGQIRAQRGRIRA